MDLPPTAASFSSVSSAQGGRSYSTRRTTLRSTLEASIQRRKAEFGRRRTIIGISPDSVSDHDKFKAKHNLTIGLAVDEEKETAEAYGVWIEKSMYGKKYMGVDRSTFLVDPKGKLARIWRKVKVEGHVQEVLDAAKALG